MKRLLTTVLAVACVGLASAQWKNPTVEATSEPIVDEPSYLYNTGTQMFLTQGNAYGTQGSVADEGLLILLSGGLSAQWRVQARCTGILSHCGKHCSRDGMEQRRD